MGQTNCLHLQSRNYIEHVVSNFARNVCVDRHSDTIFYILTAYPTSTGLEMNQECCCEKVNEKILHIQATKALRVGTGIALPYLKPRH